MPTLACTCTVLMFPCMYLGGLGYKMLVCHCYCPGFCYSCSDLASVVQRVEKLKLSTEQNTIQWIAQIVLSTLILSIVFYLVNSVIHPTNNWILNGERRHMLSLASLETLPFDPLNFTCTILTIDNAIHQTSWTATANLVGNHPMADHCIFKRGRISSAKVFKRKV